MGNELWIRVEKSDVRRFSSERHGFPQVFHTNLWMKKALFLGVFP